MFGDGIFGDVIFADLQMLDEGPTPTPFPTPGDGAAVPPHYRRDDDEVAELLAVIL